MSDVEFSSAPNPESDDGETPQGTVVGFDEAVGMARVYRVVGHMGLGRTFHAMLGHPNDRERIRQSVPRYLELTEQQLDAIDTAAMMLAQASLYTYEGAHSRIVGLLVMQYHQEQYKRIIREFGEWISARSEDMARIVSKMDFSAVEQRIAQVYAENGSECYTMHPYSFYDLYSVRQPNYDAWWKGLEHVRQRHQRRDGTANGGRSNTRGSYTYGRITKACSYWRHTRAR